MQDLPGPLPLDLQRGMQPAAPMPLRVVETDFRNDLRWLEFISAHRDTLIYHHPEWLAALEKEYGRKCIALACEDGNGKFQGVLPLLPTRGLPFHLGRNQVGRRLSSLPRTPLAGPLATSDQAMTALLQAAIDLIRHTPNTQLELKTTTPGLEKLLPELQCVRWRETYVRGLPKNLNLTNEIEDAPVREVRSCGPCESCRDFTFGNSRENHQVKWAATKAIKEGLSIRSSRNDEDLQAWYRLYLRTMRRNGVPPRSFRFFQQLWNGLRTGDNLEFVLVERSQRRLNDSHGENKPPVSACPGRLDIVSGAFLLRFGATVFWAFTGSDAEGSRLHANDLTLWHCLHESCRLGYRLFDLGEVAESHRSLAQFKAKWGTVLRPMYRYYYPAQSPFRDGTDEDDVHVSARLAGIVWKRLPLGAVALLGDWIYRFL